VLFFGLFFPLAPHWKRLNSAIFRDFFAIYRSFFRCPPLPGTFSADALGSVSQPVGFHLCRTDRVMSVGRGAWPPWIFKHITNIVDRGLKVLFYGLFCYFSAFFCCSPPLLENFLPTPLVESVDCNIKAR